MAGHDWGGCHVQRVAATRPDLIRSWCNDVAGCTDPDYVWHDLAQTWQTPGAGEAAIGQMFGGPAEDLAAELVAAGMTTAAAEATANADGAEMGPETGSGRAERLLHRAGQPVGRSDHARSRRSSLRAWSTRSVSRPPARAI